MHARLLGPEQSDNVHRKGHDGTFCSRVPPSSTKTDAELADSKAAALQEAAAEGLDLESVCDGSGYLGVKRKLRGTQVRFEAWHGGRYLGVFSTAEEAAVCSAKSRAEEEAEEPPSAGPTAPADAQSATAAAQAAETVAGGAARPRGRAPHDGQGQLMIWDQRRGEWTRQEAEEAQEKTSSGLPDGWWSQRYEPPTSPPYRIYHGPNGEKVRGAAPRVAALRCCWLRLPVG